MMLPYVNSVVAFLAYLSGKMKTGRILQRDGHRWVAEMGLCKK
jgi:hypothetical protein